jgi:GH25 family lysozyme M1 (1,4-beta-N-acetylmuramidase)
MRLRVVSALLLLPMLSASAVSATASLGAPTAFAPEGATLLVDGPDVSSYQHPNGAAISWPAVRKSGREFAIVKATEGTSYINPWFRGDYAGVKNAAMVRGSYHFARPGRPIASTAVAQARFYVARLGDVTALRTLPPALDLENTGGLSRTELTIWAQDFLLEVRRLTGRTPMVYSYPYFWQHEVGDAAALARYPLWMASYSGAVDPTASLWQYTASASVSGIRGGVDMSRVTNGTEWTTMSDGTLPSPWPATTPGPPQRVVPTPGIRSAVVTWLPPDAGTSPLTGYDVRVVGTGQVVRLGPTGTHAAFGGLVTGHTYTITVTPRNVFGSGVTVSRTVVPISPTSLVTSVSAKSIYIGSLVRYVAAVRNSDSAAPRVGVPVDVFSRPLGSPTWGFWQRMTTDAAGQIQFVRAPTRSTQFRLYYPGDPGVQPAEAVITTLVRTRIVARLSHTIAAAGVPIVLSGAISPRFSGIVVARQVWTHGVWRTVATTRTGGAGSYLFRLKINTRSTTYMRTVVAANHNRAPGYSNHVSLSIR